MFLYRYLFLIFLFVPITGYALPSSPYSNTFVLSDSSLYLADNNEYSMQSSMRTINQGRYIGGGVASIFLGFGIGYAIQGRWKEKGWIHTALQGGMLLTYISVVFTAGADHNSAVAGLGTTLGIGIAILGIRIWEMVDVWLLPDSIKIISSNQQTDRYIFSSLYSYEYKADVPGIGLQWRF